MQNKKFSTLRKLLLITIFPLLIHAGTATAALITVNSSGDTNARDTALTLREAILFSNGALVLGSLDASEQAQIDTGASTTRNTIEFNISGGGTAQTISLGSSVAQISVPVLINGTTQLGIDATTPGIVLEGNNSVSTGFEIGGTGGGSEIRGFAIGGFTDRGIFLNASTGNVVAGNYLGTDITGTAANGNGDGSSVTDCGIRVNFGMGNTIGGTTAADRNIISGNNLTGVFLTSSAQNVQIIGNYVGTDVTGTVALPNLGEGFRLDASPTNHTIGGPTAAERNIISGNGTTGITIRGDDNFVYGNYIGTDVTGTSALPNGTDGIYIMERTADNNTIGGINSTPGALGNGNLLSGNTGAGIKITGNDITVRGNFIGTDPTGTFSVPNSVGIEFEDDADDSIDSATRNFVGGTNTTPGVLDVGNLISGNTGPGILFKALTSENTVQGNFIGTDISGTIALGNGDSGIKILADSPDHLIGGANTTSGQLDRGNLIAGNAGHGIEIEGDSNTIAGNFIGTDISGRLELSNGADGVLMQNNASANTIGGTAANTGNTIAFNTGGVVVSSATALNNAIRANAIFDNTALGIDLADDGVTTNDADDSDSGANGLQNFPVISDEGEMVDGVLDSLPNTTYRIELFASAVADPSGFGEGESLLTAFDVTTDAAGHAEFSVTVGITHRLGLPWLSATATDPNNNTSEFSQVSRKTLQTITFDAAPSVSVGNTGTINASGGGSGNPVVLTSLTTDTCTLSGAQVTGVMAGLCTVAANQAGDSTYTRAAQQTLNFVIAKGSQSITFAELSDRPVSPVPFNLTATGGDSGNPVTFTSLTTAVCSTGGSNGITVSLQSAGTCTIQASQAGNDDYNAAPNVDRSFTVSNANPTLNAPATTSILEDQASSALTITVNDAETSPDNLLLSATSSDQTLITDAALANGAGGSGNNRTLMITPVADAFGSATITLTVTDGFGGIANTDIVVTVDPVNDTPSFILVNDADQIVGIDGGLQTVPGFAYDISPGPDNELDQTLEFILTVSGGLSFATAPAIDATSGELIYELIPDSSGTAFISVVLRDDGGTDNEGVDTSPVQRFSIRAFDGLIFIDGFE